MAGYALAYALAGMAALLWGVVVIPIKRARTSGRLGIAISMATGTIVMLALAISWPAAGGVGELITLSYAEFARFLVTGALQFTLGCMLYYIAIQHGSLSIAVPITRVKVLIILFLSVLLGLEVFRWGLLGAALLVFLGGALLSKPSARADEAERGDHWRSIAFAVGACIFWAVGETLIGTLPERVPPIAANGMMLGCGLVTWCVYALISGAWRELLAMPGHDIWCYMAHGLISFSAAYALFVAAIQMVGPPRVVIITSTYPLISALVGWVLYHERFSARLVTGAALLIGGVIVLQFV
ncbi:MAG: DMT family transporter [Armatimonadota bacterium]